MCQVSARAEQHDHQQHCPRRSESHGRCIATSRYVRLHGSGTGRQHEYQIIGSHALPSIVASAFMPRCTLTLIADSDMPVILAASSTDNPSSLV